MTCVPPLSALASSVQLTRYVDLAGVCVLGANDDDLKTDLSYLWCKQCEYDDEWTLDVWFSRPLGPPGKNAS